MSAEDRAKRRLLIAGGLVLAAIVIVGIVIAVTSGGGSKTKTTATPTSATSAKPADTSGLNGVAAVEAEFAGIPQKGNELGQAGAPATMMVFADMQCPFCAEFENKAMPEIVKRYVRTGKLKLVFQPIAILGDDSVTGARGVAAAAQQNKLFEYAALVYRNQGEEGSGYLDDAYVKQVAGATPGLDTAKFTADLKSAAVDKLMTDAQSIATSGKVESTPSFFVSKAGATLEPLQVTELTPEAFTSQLDKLTS